MTGGILQAAAPQSIILDRDATEEPGHNQPELESQAGLESALKPKDDIYNKDTCPGSMPWRV